MAFNKYGMKENSEWNLNQLYSEVLRDLIVEINKASTIGVLSWYQAAKTLYINMYGIPKLNAKDLTECGGKLQSGINLLKSLKKDVYAKNLSSQEKYVVYQAKEHIEEAIIKMLSLLRDGGHIFPSGKQDARYSALEIK